MAPYVLTAVGYQKCNSTKITTLLYCASCQKMDKEFCMATHNSHIAHEAKLLQWCSNMSVLPISFAPTNTSIPIIEEVFFSMCLWNPKALAQQGNEMFCFRIHLPVKLKLQ